MHDPIEVGEDALSLEYCNVDVKEKKKQTAPKSTVSFENRNGDYCREEIIRIGEEMKHHDQAWRHAEFDFDAYQVVQKIPNEGIYSREAMMIMRSLKHYTWQRDLVPDKDGLVVMNRWFPDERRTYGRVDEKDYWIWYNVNAQQSFPVFWCFFPFHLPHFDAESFISIARSESIVPDYLMSLLYQQHLMLREAKEGETYHREQELKNRTRLVEECKRMKRFPLTDEHSVVRYEDQEKNVRVCSPEQAQSWLLDGHFTSTMNFLVAPRGEAWSEQRWMVHTMNDLISRNGSSMPFLFWSRAHNPTGSMTSGVEEAEEMLREMTELTGKRSELERDIKQIQLRNDTAHREMQRIAGKFPSLAYRSAQTNATMSLATKMEAFEPSHPQFVPRPGVDPFALLRTAPKDSMTRQITGEAEIQSRFEQLRKRFDRCDKKLLVLRTTNMISKVHPATCQLCVLKIESASTFIEHVTCRKHVNKVTTVCVAALDFWLGAIGEVTKNSNGSSFSPLSILSFCSGVPNPHPNLQLAATIMHHKLKYCDKKLLDGETALRALFKEPVSCSVCVLRRVVIDKPANLISHFATQGHVAAATKGGGQMHAEVIDYWMRALDRATVSGMNY